MKKDSHALHHKLHFAELHEYWLNVGKVFLKCQRVLNQRLAEHEISIAQHEILLNIKQQPDMTAKELAKRLLVVKSNVSNLLKKLNQSGLVEIRSNKEDQRAKLICLTAAGEALVQETELIQREVVISMVKRASAADLQHTNSVMLGALASLSEYEAGQC